MIPQIEVLMEGYYFFARRNGELARYVRRHVVAALGEATTLAGGRKEDEPAALFYAFARRDQAFPPALWSAFVERLAVWAAQALGLALRPDVDPYDLAYLCLDVAEGKVPYDSAQPAPCGACQRQTRRMWRCRAVGGRELILCEDCKVRAFELSFGRLDAAARATPVAMESNRQRH
jgi:hypothetical protein